MSSVPSRRILVVDDDEGIREMVELALADAGHEVLTAAHGAMALEVLSHTRPDVILLDMRMPVMDGWEFALHYRQAPVRAPVIVLTAAPDAARRADDIGAAGYLAKPFTLTDLLRVIDTHAGDARGS